MINIEILLRNEELFYQMAKNQPQTLYQVIKNSFAPAAAPPKAAKPAAPAAPMSASAGLFPSGHKGYPGLTKPEYGKLVYKKEYTCPFCQKTFSDYKVYQSKLYESKPVRYDLRRYYADFQCEWYDVITCPYCYFSAFFTYYSEPRPFSKAKIEKDLAEAKKSLKLNFAAERDIDFVFCAHYLALLCAPGYAASYRQLKAKLWGNLSWLYEDVADEEMTRFAAAQAAEAYEAVYLESKLSPVQEQVVCLTTAGMLYRAGLEGNMKKYLFSAKTNTAGNKVYADLADSMMEMLREEEK